MSRHAASLGARNRGLALIAVLTLASSVARAQDAPQVDDEATEERAREVPTAADETVLGESPLRAEPVPGGPAPIPPESVLQLPAEIDLFRLPRPPFYETWWFWTSVSAVVLGIVLTIVVAVTSDDAPATTSGLVLRW